MRFHRISEFIQHGLGPFGEFHNAFSDVRCSDYGVVSQFSRVNAGAQTTRARRNSLARFVGLPPSPLERREKLEQLRALEAGMRIDVAIVDSVPLGVDTPEELEKARALLAL